MHLLQERQEKYEFIKNYNNLFPVEKMCYCLKLSKNSYYSWLKSKLQKVTISRKDFLINKIREIFDYSRQTYGSPRIKKELEKQGIVLSKSYVGRIMREANLKVKVKKRFVNTTQSNHSLNIYENNLNRDFTVDQLGKVWVSDITYIKVSDNWVYLTTMIDLADRKVVGWSLSEDMTYKNTVYKAWIMARRKRSIIDGFILHSDRGVQYACKNLNFLISYSKFASQSMSRKGNCWDNAVAESFFKTIKVELIYRNKYTNFKQAFDSIYDYIENWYNIKRIHYSIGYYKSPLEIEIRMNERETA